MKSITSRPRSTGRTVAAVLLALLVPLAACTTPGAQPAPPPLQSYRVGPPDVLTITIMPDPIIEREAVVRPDGMISVDLIGDIPAAGRSPQEISEDIKTRISRFKRNAQVTVAVGAALSSQITVLGEIRRPSTFPMQRQTRVVEAMGAVGGLTIFGARTRVRVIRYHEGKTIRYTVNMKNIENGNLATNILLQGGDLIVVPPSNWASVGFALRAALFPFHQLLGFGAQVSNTFFLGL
jgi:polysaccharide export outer membrane protein